MSEEKEEQIAEFWKDVEGSVWATVILDGGDEQIAMVLQVDSDKMVLTPNGEEFSVEDLELPGGVMYEDLQTKELVNIIPIIDDE